LYYPDSFQKPNPFTPDVIVPIDGVVEKKLDALDKLVSQFHEGGANGSTDLMPADPGGQKDRARQVREIYRGRQKALRTRFQDAVATRFGAPAAEKIQYVEAFEICEYGRRPDKEE